MTMIRWAIAGLGLAACLAACAVNPVPTPATSGEGGGGSTTNVPPTSATDSNGKTTADAAATASDTFAAGGWADSSASSDATGGTEDTLAAGDGGGLPADATQSETSAAETASADAAAPANCTVPAKAGHHQLNCGEIVYDLHVPAACVGGPCGLVVDVHGMTMSAAMQDANTGMRALGEANGYVVLQPNANPAPPGSSWNPNTDDDKILSYLSAVIAALKIDQKRVHFMGFSQGGWMSWRMVCKHPGIFASIAPGAGCSFSGTEGCAFADGQPAPAPVPVLYMHGTKDVLQPFDCAKQQINATIKGWQLKPVKTLEQDDKHVWTRYEGGTGAQFEFIQHDYAAGAIFLGGHCYPGSSDDGKAAGQLASFACKDPAAFHWGKAAMAFFIAHPKK